MPHSSVHYLDGLARWLTDTDTDEVRLVRLLFLPYYDVMHAFCESLSSTLLDSHVPLPPPTRFVQQ